MGDSDDGSSSDEAGAYMSAAEELSLSPTPNNYGTPALNDEASGDLVQERGEVEEVKKNKKEGQPQVTIRESPTASTLPGGCGGESNIEESSQVLSLAM